MGEVGGVKWAVRVQNSGEEGRTGEEERNGGGEVVGEDGFSGDGEFWILFPLWAASLHPSSAD